jgi:hypothetical protein
MPEAQTLPQPDEMAETKPNPYANLDREHAEAIARSPYEVKMNAAQRGLEGAREDNNEIRINLKEGDVARLGAKADRAGEAAVTSYDAGQVYLARVASGEVTVEEIKVRAQQLMKARGMEPVSDVAKDHQLRSVSESVPLQPEELDGHELAA